MILFMLILLILNVILVKQNISLKASLSTRPKRDSSLEPGMKVPALEGKDLDGNEMIISYGSDRRKTVLLSFSPQCGFCEKNMPNWDAITKNANKDLFRVAAVSLIAHGTKEYIARHNFVDTPLIAEIKAENKIAYKFNSTPQTLLIDADGKVEKVWTGLIRGEVRKEVEQALSIELPSESEKVTMIKQREFTLLPSHH